MWSLRMLFAGWLSEKVKIIRFVSRVESSNLQD